MRYHAWAATLASLFLLFSCNANQMDPDVVKGFTLDKASSDLLVQSVPAEASSAMSITFDAPSAWSVSARETRSVSWLTVEPDHGEAGMATVRFILDPNVGTEARTAEVTFTCESGSFDVKITQEGQTSVTPMYEKHPVVPSDKRMSYAAYVDSDGKENEVMVFSYGNDGKLSKITYFQHVQDGFCTPESRSEIAFTRSGGSTHFDWTTLRRVGAEVDEDYDGMVQIDGKGQVSMERIYYTSLDRVPLFKERIEEYDCKFQGKDMVLTSVSEDDGVRLEFSYDEEGNLTYARSIEVDDDEESVITGEWQDGNMMMLKNTYKYYSYGISGGTEVEETQQFSITYTDRPNPFTGVSINVFLLEDVFGLGPFLDDFIIGLQTKNLPARFEYTSSYSSSYNRTYDCSYSFDDEGRVTSATVSSSTGAGHTIRFHYSAQSVPVINTRDDPFGSLLSQDVSEVVYDEGTCSNVIVLKSLYADGHTTPEMIYPELNFLEIREPFALYPSDPEKNPGAVSTFYDMTRDQYESLGPVSVKYAGETVVEEGEYDYSAKRISSLYVLDYGRINLYARVGWYTQACFDYIAWWDGSKIRFLDCSQYFLNPKDARLEPTAAWYLSEINSSSGKMNSALLRQPLRLVWPNGQAVNSRYGQFEGSIYLTFAGDGI